MDRATRIGIFREVHMKKAKIKTDLWRTICLITMI